MCVVCVCVHKYSSYRHTIALHALLTFQPWAPSSLCPQLKYSKCEGSVPYQPANSGEGGGSEAKGYRCDGEGFGWNG